MFVHIVVNKEKATFINIEQKKNSDCSLMIACPVGFVSGPKLFINFLMWPPMENYCPSVIQKY